MVDSRIGYAGAVQTQHFCHHEREDGIKGLSKGDALAPHRRVGEIKGGTATEATREARQAHGHHQDIKSM